MKQKSEIRTHVKAVLLLLLAAFLLQLKWYSSLVCIACYAVLSIGWKRIRKEERRQQKRLEEAGLYMEQLLYAFMQNQQILAALEDIRTLFREGNMSECIGKAIERMKAEHDATSREALYLIEKEYDCARIRQIHSYLLYVERYGGAFEETLEFLLEDIHKFMERVSVYQADCRKYRRNVWIAAALSVIICAITNALLPGDLEIAGYTLCQAASVLLLCLDMLICRRTEKKTARDWLKTGQMDEQVDWDKKYMRYKKSRGFLRVVYERDMKKKVQLAFPQWLMEMALLLQSENVQVALHKSRQTAPPILRPAIGKLVEELNQNPESLEPYMNFLKEYQIPDVQSAMRMLYALSNGGYGNGNQHLTQIMRRNQELLDKAERSRNEDSLAGLYALFLTPALTGAGKMLVDMTMFLVVFLTKMHT